MLSTLDAVRHDKSLTLLSHFIYDILTQSSTICNVRSVVSSLDRICVCLGFFKMAPRMAAVVWNAPVLLMFLFVRSVFSHSISISFTRDELLDIRTNTPYTPDKFFQVFEYSDALLDVLVGGAAVLVKRALRRKKKRSAPARWLSSANAASELRSQAFISRISDPFLTKRMNYFSSPAQTRTFQTLLHCASLKPGWVKPSWITGFICRAISCSDQIASRS